MSKTFEPLDPDEVISFGIRSENSDAFFKLPLTFRTKELESGIKGVLSRLTNNCQNQRTLLLNEGLDGEALRFGSREWQKGKIRVKIEVEFCPDDVENSAHTSDSSSNPRAHEQYLESPLDDIRSIINES